MGGGESEKRSAGSGEEGAEGVGKGGRRGPAAAVGSKIEKQKEVQGKVAVQAV
jgi:hypothetical protein